jgi:hypothetical protein
VLNARRSSFSELATGVRCTRWVKRLVIALLFAAACTSSVTPAPTATSSPTTDCRPTIARMTPPEPFFNFVVGGSSQPEITRQRLLASGNFYGNDAVWVLLPENGEARVGGDKFLVWRLKAGTLNYIARRVDGRGADLTMTLDARSGYGDVGFQPGGVDLPTAGCWEVTYQINGSDDLKFILLAK